MRNSCPTSQKLRYYLLLSFLGVGLIALAQNKVVTGRITDAKDGSAISNVSVIANGTRLGTQTDAKGYFHFTVPLSVTTLTLSAVGFSSKDIDVSTTDNIEVALEAISSTLDEVVVIGYGTAFRKDITGAVDKITSDDFNKGIITSPLQELQGKVAGLVIVQPGGDPNGESTVRLRGATSMEGQPPLLVIDGIAIDDFQKAIATLNPSDVESFDILKDASAAAIYGARGANGVIFVTTKKGRTGKIIADYTGYVGIEKTGHRLDLLSGDEWRKATAGMNAGSLDAGGNTDWQKVISQTAFSHSHSIGISGGTDQLNIRGSVGYIKQQGIILNTGKEMITSRINAVQKTLKNKLEIRYGINTSLSNGIYCRSRLLLTSHASAEMAFSTFQKESFFLYGWSIMRMVHTTSRPIIRQIRYSL